MNPYSSPTTSSLSTLRSKAPILNPYDKFSQTDFDAWIGNITTSLRHALDPEDESLQPLPPTPSHPIRSRLATSDLGNEVDYAEGDADDSFAEVIQRRLTAKGKQRDPAEGPGLYYDRGAQEAPIEILDDDEEEEEEEEADETEQEGDFFDEDAWDEHEVNASIMVVDGDVSDNEDYDLDEPPSRFFTEVTDAGTPASRAKDAWASDNDYESAASVTSADHSPEPKESTVSSTRVDKFSDDDRSGSEAGEGNTYISDDEADDYAPIQPSSPLKEVIEVLSDEEQEPEQTSQPVEEEEETEEEEERPSDVERGYLSSEEDNDELRSDEEQQGETGSSNSDIVMISPAAAQKLPTVKTSDGRTRRASFFSEELPTIFQEVTAALNNADVPQSQYPRDALTVPSPEQVPQAQDEDEDEPFPPVRDEEPQPLQLQDPWLGPKMYAEDFYAGGDFIEDPVNASPDKLTALDNVASSVSTPFLGEITPVSTKPPSPVATNRAFTEIIDVDADEETPAWAPPPEEQGSSGSSTESSDEQEAEPPSQAPYIMFTAGQSDEEDADGSSEEEASPGEYPPLGTSDLDVYSPERAQSVEEGESSSEPDESLEEVRVAPEVIVVEQITPRSSPPHATAVSTPPPNEPEDQPPPLSPAFEDDHRSPIASPLLEQPVTFLTEQAGDEQMESASTSNVATVTPHGVDIVSYQVIGDTEDHHLHDEQAAKEVTVAPNEVNSSEESQDVSVERAGIAPPLIVDLDDKSTEESATPQEVQVTVIEASDYEDALPEEGKDELKPQLTVETSEAFEPGRVKFDIGPITADPNMPDPFDSYYDTFSGPLSAAKHPDFRGLFTPADGSTSGNTTPVTKPSPDMPPNLRLQTETEPSLHRALLAHSITPVASPAIRSPLGLHTPVRRSAVPPLVADPYPANLSTPGYDHHNMLQDSSDTSYDTSSTSMSSGSSEGDGSSSSPSLPTEHLEDSSIVLVLPTEGTSANDVVDKKDKPDQEPLIALGMADANENVGSPVQSKGEASVVEDLESPAQPVDTSVRSPARAISPLPTPSMVAAEEQVDELQNSPSAPEVPLQDTSVPVQKTSPTNPGTPSTPPTPQKSDTAIEIRDEDSTPAHEIVTAEEHCPDARNRLETAALDAVRAIDDLLQSCTAAPETLLETDPFKLMGSDNTVAPGEVVVEGSDSSSSATPEMGKGSPDTVAETPENQASVTIEQPPSQSSQGIIPPLETKPSKPSEGRSTKRKRSTSFLPSEDQKAPTNATNKPQISLIAPPEDFVNESVYTIAQAQAFPEMLFHAHGRSAAPLRPQNRPLVIPNPPKIQSRTNSQTDLTTVAVLTETVAAAPPVVVEPPKVIEEPPRPKSPTPAPLPVQESTETEVKNAPMKDQGAVIGDAVTHPTSPSIPASQETVIVPVQEAPPIPPKPEVSKSKAKRYPIVGHSPVTRSHCRYHKISITRDEDDGPRIHFLVPGCSMGNKKLLQEENIIDFGVAQPEDTQRLIEDVETLDFVPALIAILRQLVGTELLKEHEAFYLPMPEDAPVHRVQRAKPKPLNQPIEKRPVARSRPTKAAPKAKIKRASTSVAPRSRSKPPSSNNSTKLSASLSVPIIRDQESASVTTPPPRPSPAPSLSVSTPVSAPAPASTLPPAPAPTSVSISAPTPLTSVSDLPTRRMESESELSELDSSSPPAAPPQKKQKQELLHSALPEVETVHPFEIGARAISATASPASLKRVRTAETPSTDLRTPKKPKLHGTLNGKH